MPHKSRIVRSKSKKKQKQAVAGLKMRPKVATKVPGGG